MNPSMANEKKQPTEELNAYHKDDSSPSSGGSAQDRDFVRNVMLAELKNFRDYLSSSWGGLGSGNTVNANGLFGFFAKQSFGAYYQSPHAVQSTVVNPSGSVAGDSGTLADGNDFGRIFIDRYNDRVSALPTGALTGAQKTPSWIFDLPQWAQKLAFVSTGPGIYYTGRTGAFTAGLILTGGTSGAKATITAVLPDAADATKGTLYISLIGTTNFTAAETVTDTSTGSATVSSRTYLSTNAILRLYGVGGQEVRTDSTVVAFDKWGAVDFFCPQRYFTWQSSFGFDPETISAFAQEGFTYVRLGTPDKLRIYLDGSWQDVGGAATSSITSQSVNMTTTSTLTYAHGLGRVPKLVRIQANHNLNYCDTSWDGTTLAGLKWGDKQSGTAGYAITMFTTAGTDACLGAITAMDATNVTINYSAKLGAPSGTCNFYIIAS